MLGRVMIVGLVHLYSFVWSEFGTLKLGLPQILNLFPTVYALRSARPKIWLWAN